jgi:glycosyltransferase involved in cell wall biosynthesis
MWVIVNTNLGSGGAERHLLQIARFLEPPDGRLKLILLEASGDWLDEGDSLCMEAIGKATPKNWVIRLVWCVAIIRRLRHRIRAERPEVLLTFLWFPTLVAAVALLGMRTRPRLIWSLQSDLNRDFRLHRDWRLRWALVRFFAVPATDCFIAASRGARVSTHRFLTVPRSKLFVVPNSIDVGRIDYLSRLPAEIPSKAPGVMRIVSLGRLHPQKGFDVLLRALHCLAQHRGDWECFILGDGEERHALTALRSRLDLETKVSLTGYVENPIAWLRSGDVFVMPSRWEPFGIAMVEAMAVGLPVIVSDTHGAHDVVSSGENGLIFKDGDSDQLCETLILLLNSPDLRRKLGESGRTESRAYDAPTIAAKYTEIISLCKHQRVGEVHQHSRRSVSKG